MNLEVDIPDKLTFLFEHWRYKVMLGGRGGSKSWGAARALLVLGVSKKLRILCTREVQKSIKDSVHKLLSDQIQALGLGQHYEVLETVIRGRNGTEFTFAGLSGQTVESIKSYEGVDIVWVEEGQTVKNKSWSILIPTIRKDNSEIWVTFNPVLDSDDTYRRFVLNPPPSAKVVRINYMDNPWFPTVLELERQHCKATESEETYNNIWEGMCRSAVEGAIYAHEISEVMTTGRLCNVPYDPLLKVHTVWDLGWNDAMAISLVQKVRSEIRVIRYIEDSHKTLDYYVAMLNEFKLNWGKDYLPHDGATKDFKTGRSTEQILKAFGRTPVITPRLSVEEGIREARMALKQTVFDRTHAERLVECLKRYRRSINQMTNEAGAPLHDEYSHGADNFRYIAVNADSMSNEDEMRFPTMDSFQPFNSAMGH